MGTEREKFWENKTLEQMSQPEWESLCDGCAKCCLHKLEDEETGEVFYTKISCQYMSEDCQCTVYQQRNELVPNCVWLRPENVEEFYWLPSTCSYRLIAQGEPLPSWHRLISGSSNSVHEQGISIKGRSLNEKFVHEDGFEEHIITWVE